MSEEPVPPEPSERGRYAVYDMPDGGLLIARTSDICDRCRDCGCGTAREPLGPVPGGVIEMAKMAAAGKIKLPNMKQLRQLAGSRGPGNGRH